MIVLQSVALARPARELEFKLQLARPGKTRIADASPPSVPFVMPHLICVVRVNRISYIINSPRPISPTIGKYRLIPPPPPPASFFKSPFSRGIFRGLPLPRLSKPIKGHPRLPKAIQAYIFSSTRLLLSPCHAFRKKRLAPMPASAQFYRTKINQEILWDVSTITSLKPLGAPRSSN
jgi:hypothetical protein